MKFENMTKTQKVFTIINYTLSFVFSLSLIGFIIAMFVLGDPHNRMMSCWAALFYYIAPVVLQLIFKHKISPFIIFVYLIFITISAYLGSCLRFNVLIPFMDKIQHFSWGYIACFIGLFFICKTNEFDTIKPLTVIVLFIAISLATATVWEIIEFTCDTFLNQTAQGTPVNGIVPVNDSMLDMICHTTGTIIFTIHYCLDRFTKLNLGFNSITTDFKTKY